MDRRLLAGEVQIENASQTSTPTSAACRGLESTLLFLSQALYVRDEVGIRNQNSALPGQLNVRVTQQVLDIRLHLRRFTIGEKICFKAFPYKQLVSTLNASLFVGEQVPVHNRLFQRIHSIYSLYFGEYCRYSSITEERIGQRG